MNKIRVGIIGAGRIGKIHVDNLLRQPEVEIAAISDLYAGSELETWANERGIATVTKNSKDIIEDPSIDAVFICATTDTHVPLIKQAAAAGKHIFCEKPISMDIAQSEEAVAAAREAGVKLQIGFNRRFDHNFKRVREHVENGVIGDVHVLKITSRDPNSPPEEYIKASGGLFIDMMIHDIDMMRFLSGSEVEEVYTQGNVLVDPIFAKYGDIDTAIVTLRFQGGAIGVIDNSRKAVYGYDQRVEVFGSKGSVSASNDYPNTVVVSSDEGIVSDKPLHFFLERYQQAYVEEVQRFIDSLVSDSPVAIEGFDGLQAERIALAAKLSYQLQRPVKLSEIYELRKQLTETI